MKNPYEDPVSEDHVLVGRRIALLGIAVFLLFASLPPLLGIRELVSDRGALSSLPTLREKLRSFEKRFSGMELFSRWRSADQGRLIQWFREGNERVLIGQDGWLYYRSDVDTVVGKGPRYEEPPSVSRDPTLEPWQAPLPIIQDFARQLQERGIDLLLVPVPTKAMVVSDGLGAKVKSAVPAGYGSVMEELRESGITVLDPMPSLKTEEIGDPLYLKQDTHWTPETMERVAGLVSNALVSQGPELNGEKFEPEFNPVERGHPGDLVGMLEQEQAESQYTEETATLRRVLDRSTGEAVAEDEQSPVTILGDSFVNVFEDPTLGFTVENEERIGAGFASHLAAQMGFRLQVLASNGGGATTVRKLFAESLAERDEDPETVVWVLSARDLFLPELPARRAGVEWSSVLLPTERREKKTSKSGLILTATLRERTAVGDPSDQVQTPYPSAIYSTLFDDVVVESGNYAAKEAWIFLWAFQDRKPSSTANLEVGNRYRLQLAPFPKDGPESKAKQLDDFFRIDLDRYFARSAEEVR